MKKQMEDTGAALVRARKELEDVKRREAEVIKSAEQHSALDEYYDLLVVRSRREKADVATLYGKYTEAIRVYETYVKKYQEEQAKSSQLEEKLASILV